ncbi:MAG: bifunctional oligoribonuclease/PAP phosphatase NrnA [Candidatus Spechtbacteria bacterium SB0662_bin_43]|uniref:Bifunctional oligoribonuclease/PAP phosphatase NrnA n=1 Tax=Candidatus Spechtbacteria bacterium SB0662_bin_43 TaxID=2604897 RepID=A0A845D9X6_9BACT|nr:bifunctional oligoribonuclease/PAP phosphatase NrnA [Candidatus Spechtbacteria bacterium SB0662_bin_43]
MITNEFREKCWKALAIIQESQHIVLAGHRNPDGDAIGSTLGFYNALYENEGKEALVYSGDSVPTSFDFLAGYSLFAHTIDWYPDCFIGFDYGDFERLNVPDDVLYGARIVSFDHHPQRRQYGDVCIIETQVASTTELLYYFMKEVGWHISARVAQCLLTGIITDTGAFAHNSFESTFHATGDLMQCGASISHIQQRIMDKQSQQRILNLWGSLLAKAHRDDEYNFLALFISFSEFQSYDIELDQLAGIVSVLNRSADVDFAILVVEYDKGIVKGSLRGEETKGVVVSRIAQQLGGGGHPYAAGFSLQMPFESARARILEAIQQCQNAAY